MCRFHSINFSTDRRLAADHKQPFFITTTSLPRVLASFTCTTWAILPTGTLCNLYPALPNMRPHLLITCAALQQLQQLQEASTCGAQALHGIVDQLREINAHLCALRGIPAITGSGVVSQTLPASHIPASSSTSGRTWVLLLGVAAVSTSAGLLLLMRSKHRTA